jgi:cell division inhibitor SepF
MASMWRRAMVYLGLQDDDELEYGGEYESYGEYGDAADEPQHPRARRDSGYDDGDPRRDQPRDSGTVRTARPDTRTDYGAPEYGAPEYGAPDPAGPAPAPRVAAPREEPSGMSAPRPSVVRTIGPTTAARVHVVEPQGFNDAQEVGDRLKANQPVILNLQGLPRELQRRLIDFSSGLAYAVAGSMQRVADQVFLLTPSNVEVSQEEKDRLQARGLFQA